MIKLTLTAEPVADRFLSGISLAGATTTAGESAEVDARGVLVVVWPVAEMIRGPAGKFDSVVKGGGFLV